MADSYFIVEYLASRLGKDMDSELTTNEKATSRAFSVMCEESLKWCGIFLNKQNCSKIGMIYCFKCNQRPYLYIIGVQSKEFFDFLSWLIST